MSYPGHELTENIGMSNFRPYLAVARDDQVAIPLQNRENLP